MKRLIAVSDIRKFLADTGGADRKDCEMAIQEPVALLLESFREENGEDPANGMALASWAANQLGIDRGEIRYWSVWIIAESIRAMFADEPDGDRPIPEHPNGWPDWLPKIIDPTPLELLDLRARLNRLNSAVRAYEQKIIGSNFGELFTSTETQKCVSELLDAMLSLGDWQFTDERLCDELAGTQSQGWPGPILWADEVQRLYKVACESVRKNGIPFDEIDRAFTLYSAENSKLQYKWNHESYVQEDPDVCQVPPVLGVNPGAVFMGFDSPFEPPETCTKNEARLNTLAPQLEIYADFVLQTIESLGTCRHLDGRVFRFDVTRIRGWHGTATPPKDHVFYLSQAVVHRPSLRIASIEEQFGIHLKKGCDPIWLIEKLIEHQRGNGGDFANAMLENYSDSVGPAIVEPSEDLPEWLGGDFVAATTDPNDIDFDVSNPTDVPSEADSLVTPLTENDRLLLQTMAELDARIHKPETGPLIVKTALYRGDIKRAFGNLKTNNLVDSKSGPSGGYWLTPLGEKMSAKITSNSCH